MVKQGYKQTEIGVIPEDWEVLKIANLVNFDNGLAHEGIENENGDFIVINSKFISTEGKVVRKVTKQLKPLVVNDICIVMSDIPNGKALAKCYLVEKNNTYTLNQRIGRIEPIKDYPKFFYYVLNRNKYYLSFDSGSGQTNLRKNEVLDCVIPLPPLREQEAIATALSDADAWIESLEHLIAKKRLIKQGAMQELLTPKEEWEVKKLGEVASYRRGSFPQPYGLDKWYDDTNGMPFIQVFDVAKNRKLKSDTKRKISDLAQPMSVFVPKGTIVLTIQGSIGRIALTQYDAYCDRTLLIFEKIDSGLDKFYFLLSVEQIFEIEKEKAPGGTIKTITKEALSDFEIKYPKSLSEQERIATILSDMDAELEALEQQLDKARQIKQGMMQELLTGRIRL